ncbi:hypothetical protein AAFC00_006404 [Neodothiora populina]|uniref:Translin n=1 Tax=Neodothiora populina TaxID=2781224 RepID=A0ABR3P535_9PEZI
MGQKRPRDETMDDNRPQSEERREEASSPFMSMFEQFRAELDEHHDRRERIIKASRDVTAASKKIIRKLAQPLPPHVAKGNEPYHTIIRDRYSSISSDLQGLNAYRYARNITGGNQEWMEAASFQHYLVTGRLITYDEAQRQLAGLAVSGQGGLVFLSVEDYLLGIFDMTGELMRFAITTMATDGKLPAVAAAQSLPDPAAAEGGAMEVDAPESKRDVLTDLRALRAELEALDVGKGGSFARDVDKKMNVMQTSVEKVEKALYGLVIRGRERPKGWMPDLDSGPRREVEVDA